MKTTRKYSLLAGAVLLSLSALSYAEVATPVSIPMVENAHVFADFTDEMPAVLNYFTSATENEVIDFYKQNFGEPIFQERKRDRLTLTYKKEHQAIRVVISEQNKKRQVDIIVESANSETG